METTTASADNELAENERPSGILVIAAVKKYIYKLPSGRRLKVIVADEREDNVSQRPAPD